MRSTGRPTNPPSRLTPALLVSTHHDISCLNDLLTLLALPGPMINALANHNILPHSGRDISFRTLNAAIRDSFNFAPSFCFFVPHFAADFLDRSYWSGKLDLEELSKHNAIEHDASLTRRDAALEPDQGKPDVQLVEQLLAGATGGTPEARLLTKQDLSAALTRRRVESRRENAAYTESVFHNGFGSAKYVLVRTLRTLDCPADLIAQLVNDANHLWWSRQ